MNGPLDGLRVTDLSRVLAGPLCSMLLGDLGADVIKVERPGSGDDTRQWGPPFLGSESAYYLSVNRNKRGITLDLSSDDARAVLARLLVESDVLVENFLPGTLERWGFDAAWFATEAPALVRATISGYGQSGPKAGQPGYDYVLQAETGLMSITGEIDGPPVKVGVAIVDVCAGMMTATSILAALNARHASGKGQQVEVNLHDTGLLMLANVASNHLVTEEDPSRHGNGHPNIVPYRTYSASDHDMVIAVGSDAQFAVLADLLDHPEWATDNRFSTNAARVENRAVIDSLIEQEISRRSRAEWMNILTEAGLTSSPINTVSEGLASPQTVASNMVVEVERSAGEALRMVGLPFSFSDTPPSIRRPPPGLGEHTSEVLAELGYSDADIALLDARGAT